MDLPKTDPPRRPSRISITKGCLGYVLTAEEKKAALEAEREEKRLFTINETISSEETYYNRLKTTFDVYIEPLSVQKILTDDDVQSIFFMWQNLVGIHKEFFSALKKDHETGKVNVAKHFKSYSDVFKMYQPYLNNYTRSSLRMAELVATDRKFSEFCQKARQNPRCENLSLMEFMMEPVQRVPRYKMLIQQLLKYTPEGHPELEETKEALEKISSVAKANDASIGMTEELRANHEQMVDTMMSFTWNTRINLLDDPARKLVRQGTLLRQTRKTIKEFYFWLFNDKLLYGMPVPGNIGLFTLHRDIPLWPFRAMIPPPRFDCEEPQRAIFIESPQKSFIVWAETLEEKHEWLKSLQECDEEIRSKHKTKDGKLAPMWTPNNSSSSCEHCETEFSLLMRRHHCRNCGSIVCSSCSTFTFKVPHVDEKREQRVCDTCLESLVSASEEFATLDEYFEKKRIKDETDSALGRVRNVFGFSPSGSGNGMKSVGKLGKLEEMVRDSERQKQLQDMQKKKKDDEKDDDDED